MTERELNQDEDHYDDADDRQSEDDENFEDDCNQRIADIRSTQNSMKGY